MNTPHMSLLLGVADRRSTSCGVDHMYFDVVIHLGLGVYDNHDTILLEDGAINKRWGRDASGSEPSELRIDRCRFIARMISQSQLCSI